MVVAYAVKVIGVSISVIVMGVIRWPSLLAL